MSATGTRVVLMNVPAKRGEKDESFEERRFLDYLHAYQTTGKPPQPVPPVPTDPQQRAALGLPPLFEPLIETESLTNGAAGTPPPTAPPNFLAQAFVPTKMLEYGNDAFQLQSIVAQPEYARFSVEVSAPPAAPARARSRRRMRTNARGARRSSACRRTRPARSTQTSPRSRPCRSPNLSPSCSPSCSPSHSLSDRRCSLLHLSCRRSLQTACKASTACLPTTDIVSRNCVWRVYVLVDRSPLPRSSLRTPS